MDQEDITSEEKERAKHLYRVLQTPIFLFYLIKIVDADNKIPSSKNEIIEIFIDRLLRRETYEQHQKEISYEDTLLLLKVLGYESLELKESNEGMEKEDVVTILRPTIKEDNLAVNLNQFLKLVIGLNILRLDNNKYTFSHQSFQDYFHSEGRL